VLVRSAAGLERLAAELDSGRRRLEWGGPAAERFHRWWQAVLAPRLAALSHGLRSAAATLTINADQQEETSRSRPVDRASTIAGDLGTARHLAVLVPGMGATTSHLPRLAADAARLRAAAGEDVAVVAWLGYEAPKGLGDAARAAAARAGALRLVHDVERLRAQTGASVTVIGHSYGSTVIGAAAHAGLRADRIVVLGSPGMGVERSLDLGLPVGTVVHAAATEGDPVAVLRHFGNDPTAPSFGAVTFDAGIGFEHSAYFREGSASLENLAGIVRGEQPTARPATRLEAGADGLRTAARSVERGLATLQRLLRSGGSGPLLDLQVAEARAAVAVSARVGVTGVDLLDDVAQSAARVIRRLVPAGR